MLGWFQAMMPKEERFFDFFMRHAEIVVAGAEALRGLLQGRRQRRALLQGHRRARSRGRRSHAAGADRGAPYLHHAVRSQRHPGSGLVDGRRHRPDEQDREGHHAVRGRRSSIRRCSRWARSSCRRRSWCWRRCRCFNRSARTRRASTHLTEEIITLEERADHLHDQGRKALFLASRNGDPDELHHRHRNLRSSGEGRRPLRGRRERDQRHRHRSPVDAALVDGRDSEPSRSDRR